MARARSAPSWARAAGSPRTMSARTTTTVSARRPNVLTAIPSPPPIGAATCLRLLRVRLHAGPIDEDTWLIAHGPRIVAGRRDHDIAWAVVDLRAVVRLDDHPAGEDVCGVIGLAAVGAGNGLHIVRPLPPRLEGPANDRDIAHREESHGDFTLAWPRLIRLVQALLCKRHVPSSSF